MGGEQKGKEMKVKGEMTLFSFTSLSGLNGCLIILYKTFLAGCWWLIPVFLTI
jgi:hypothetical protein